MKRNAIRIVALMVLLLFCMSGCSLGEATGKNTLASTTTAASEEEPVTEKEINEPELSINSEAHNAESENFGPTTAASESGPESNPTDISVDIPWTTAVYSVVDNDGYTFDIEFKLSPWILLSDNELITSVWSEVGGNSMLPQFEDWGFERSGSKYRRALTYYNTSGPTEAYDFSISDMYYSVGAITIKNTTEGFDITQEAPRNVKFSWGYDYKKLEGCVIGRIMHSDSETTKLGGLYIDAAMSNNIWGSCPFVLMSPEYFSPNIPNGMADYILSEDITFDFSHAVPTLPGIVGLNKNPPSTGKNPKVHLGILTGDGEHLTSTYE